MTGVELADGSTVTADAVIAAPGREGADWLAEQAHDARASSSSTTRSTSACASSAPRR